MQGALDHEGLKKIAEKNKNCSSNSFKMAFTKGVITIT